MNELNASQKKLFDKISLLLPVLPVVFFFLHSLNQFNELIFTFGVLLLFLIYSSFSFILFFCLTKIPKLSLSQSFFLGTLITTSFLFFGVLQDTLLHLKKIQFLSNSLFLLFFIFTIIVSLSFLIKKKRYNPGIANRFITLLFLVLIGYEIFLFSITMIRGKSIYAIADDMTSPVLITKNQTKDVKPDIYHIVFDGYTNRPAFNEFWEYDNDIYPFLTSKGFYTVDSAMSNYKSTPFSISSTFNLQYLKGAGPYLVSNSSNFLVGQRTYIDNLLFSFLKQEEYQLSNFSQLENEKLLTGFGFLGVEKPSNWLRKLTMERIYLNPWIISKISKFFKGADKLPTMIKRSMKSFRDYNNNALQHVSYNCEKYAKSGEAAPLFSYTHFMIPHDPYQVDKEGNFIPSAQPGTNNMKGYLEQVKYSNKLIRQITGCLLSDTTRKKIIIFQGDHGYRHFGNASSSKQYGALNAFYFYNNDYEGLAKHMSHVNTYRIVLNKFFGTQLSILKDSIK